MTKMGLRGAMFFRSFFLQAGFSDERRQGLGFAWAIDPALRAAYPGGSRALTAARIRHLDAFNTQPFVSGLILGIVACLEAPGREERVSALKSSLGASLAASADSFFWGALRPLAAALAVLLALIGRRFGVPHSFAIAALLGLAAFNIPAVYARWVAVDRGLKQGDKAALALAALPVRSWIRATRLTAAGLVLVCAGTALFFTVGIGASRLLATGAFAVGAGLSRALGGPWRLLAGCWALSMTAAAFGWRP